MRTLTTSVAGLALLALVAYLLGLFGHGPAMPAAATPEDCYAATVAAAVKPNPTNVPCDWQKVRAASPGAAFNGRYESATAGLTGRLVVMESADRAARLALSTAGESPRYICTAALEATRRGDTLVARPADVTGCEIILTSAATPNVVRVVATEPCAAYCNMRGGPGGDFKLVAE